MHVARMPHVKCLYGRVGHQKLKFGVDGLDSTADPNVRGETWIDWVTS